MVLTDFIIQYLAHEKFEKIYQSEDYQEAWERKNAAEKELIETLTRKQRRMFHECIRQKDTLTAVELSHILEGCGVVISNGFFVTPKSQNPGS